MLDTAKNNKKMQQHHTQTRLMPKTEQARATNVRLVVSVVPVPIFEEGLNSDKQSIKTIQTLFPWVNIPPHTKFH